MTEQLKTGTTTLAIVCKDGIVIAADKRMTSGTHIFAEGVEKVIPIDERNVLTIAGEVLQVIPLPPGTVTIISSLINIGLRVFTTEPVKILPTKK